MTGARQAALLLFAVSGSLLLGALGFQFLGGLAPCEMCFWQRYAHLAVLAVSALAWLMGSRALGWLAVIAMVGAAGLGHRAGKLAGDKVRLHRPIGLGHLSAVFR